VNVDFLVHVLAAAANIFINLSLYERVNCKSGCRCYMLVIQNLQLHASSKHQWQIIHYHSNVKLKLNCVRFEVSTAVTMMIIIFWEMTPCGSSKNRRFGGSYRLHLQGERVRADTE
jgi:hypothetical protein